MKKVKRKRWIKREAEFGDKTIDSLGKWFQIKVWK